MFFYVIFFPIPDTVMDV